MGLFEDMVVNTKAAVLGAGKVAGKFVDISKLRISSAEMHAQISKKLSELGMIVYKDYKDNKEEPDKSSIKSLVTEIDDLYKEFHRIQKKIAFIKNKLKCKKCGYENEQGSRFCTRCGEKLLDEPFSEEDN